MNTNITIIILHKNTQISQRRFKQNQTYTTLNESVHPLIVRLQTLISYDAENVKWMGVKAVATVQ